MFLFQIVLKMQYLRGKGRSLLNRMRRKSDKYLLIKIGEMKNAWRRLDHSNQAKSPDAVQTDKACTKEKRISRTRGIVDSWNKTESKCEIKGGFQTNFPRRFGTNEKAVTTAISKSDVYDTTRKATMSKDIITQRPFDYDGLFLNEVQEKKQNHTYWVMKKVQKCNLFPYAEEHTGRKTKVSVWSGNDYLGMNFHPGVIAAAKDGLERHGTGSGGARFMTGNSLLHEKLEREIADLHLKESALLLSSCYTANDSTLITLGKHLPGVHIFFRCWKSRVYNTRCIE